jgi:hypothetical protein
MVSSDPGSDMTPGKNPYIGKYSKLLDIMNDIYPGYAKMILSLATNPNIIIGLGDNCGLTCNRTEVAKETNLRVNKGIKPFLDCQGKCLIPYLKLGLKNNTSFSNIQKKDIQTVLSFYENLFLEQEKSGLLTPVKGLGGLPLIAVLGIGLALFMMIMVLIVTR